MARIKEAVFDTGPPLHLHEIKCLSIFDIAQNKLIPPEVEDELKHYQVPIQKFIVKILSGTSKNLAAIFSEKFEMALGEASAIALAKQEKIRHIFTDDLNARNIAKNLELEVHGTLGLITRAFREKIMTKTEAIKCVKKIYEDSSLFLTKYLVDFVIKEIQSFK